MSHVLMTQNVLDKEVISDLGYPKGTYCYFDLKKKAITTWKPHFKNHPADRIASEVTQNLFVSQHITKD